MRVVKYRRLYVYRPQCLSFKNKQKDRQWYEILLKAAVSFLFPFIETFLPFFLFPLPPNKVPRACINGFTDPRC